MDLVEALRGQADACGRLGSAMYDDLLTRAALDVEAGGPVAHVLRDHAHDPGPSALALRLTGSVHRLVLERRAGPLATFYPSVGGVWEPEAGWTAFRDLLAEHPDAVEEWLDRPPQTNEVGRSAALMAGLLHVEQRVGLPIRLFEIGSSGGLNLLADRFRYVTDDGRTFGPVDSPVVLDPAWRGPGPYDAPWPRIVERVGSDVMPVDVRSTQGRLVLTAYVWPDQTHRHERLRGALALAQETPYDVTPQGAAAFVDALTLAPGSVTVLWHSVMWQYLERTEQDHVRARIEELGAGATATAPLVHLFHEPTRRRPGAEHEMLLVAETWPGASRVILGRVHSHGVPTTWETSDVRLPSWPSA